MREKVLIVDFGGQYVHLIARRCRELGVYSEIVDVERLGEVNIREYSALILSGGPRSVSEEGAPTVDRSVIASGMPVLGICYGHQLIAKLMGGRVERSSVREYGRTEVEVVADSVLFSGLGKRQVVWMSHGDVVLEPPPSFRVTAVSETGAIAAMEDPGRGSIRSSSILR